MRITRKIPLKGDQPPKRSDHSLVKFKEYLFIFGGCEDQSKHNDLYRIDLNSNTVVSPLTLRFRKSRSMEKCLSRGLATVPRWWGTSMLVFGGWNGFETQDELYQFSFGSFE